jgi:hypothetical protein
VLTMAASAGGAGAAEPARTTPPPRTAKPVPVVLVPGLTGSQLRDRDSHALVWGTGAQLLRPRDGGYAMALPLAADAPAEPRLEAFAVVEQIRLAGILGKEIYGPILEMLESRGHLRGDLANPEAGGTVFAFPYDWRLSNVITARRLGEALERLRRVRGEDRLAVDLVCQSNGAHVCRYLLKYGGATLEEAESGTAGPPPRLAVRKLVLLGSSNGGALRILHELDRGRTYVPIIGRKMQPETIFTFPAIYQDLPVYTRDLFVDAAGKKLDVDLFDAAEWRRHGWSIFNPGARRRLAEDPHPELFADEARQLEFLRTVLDETRRFHQLLRRDVEGFAGTRYYLLQSKSLDTPSRAVLVEDRGGWRTLFTGDREVERNPRLQAVTSAPGDAHATVESQMWLSPQETAALAREPAYVDSGHRELLADAATLERLADFLEEP